MKKFDEFLEIVERLRSKDGCPWDREQTIKSLKSDLEDEYKEVIEAIDKEDYENLKEEIGDLIWTLALVTQIAKEEGLFDMEDVMEAVTDKMIRRHPHVFGDAKAENAEDAKRLFYEAKANEKKNHSRK